MLFRSATALQSFKKLSKAAAAATVLGYGSYRLIDSWNNYSDKVDQTYRVVSIKAIPVAETAVELLGDWAANLAPKTSLVRVVYTPKTQLAKGDAIELGAVSEEDAEKGSSPTPTGTPLDGYKWTVVNINTPGEAIINMADHGLSAFDGESTTGTMKVHSSYEGTLARDFGEDAGNAISKGLEVFGDALETAGKGLGLPDWFTTENIQMVVMLIILFIALIYILKFIYLIRGAFGSSETKVTPTKSETV